MRRPLKRLFYEVLQLLKFPLPMVSIPSSATPLTGHAIYIIR